MAYNTYFPLNCAYYLSEKKKKRIKNINYSIYKNYRAKKYNNKYLNFFFIIFIKFFCMILRHRRYNSGNYIYGFNTFILYKYCFEYFFIVKYTV